MYFNYKILVMKYDILLIIKYVYNFGIKKYYCSVY